MTDPFSPDDDESVLEAPDSLSWDELEAGLSVDLEADCPDDWLMLSGVLILMSEPPALLARRGLSALLM